MEHTIINNEDYKLKVRKTWVEPTKIWHIEFMSASIYENRFEMFLTDNELQKLKDTL
jgi:hypothetical protein